MVDANIDYYLIQLQNMLMWKIYKTSDYDIFIKKDGQKERVIYKLPYFPDRICHWAIIQQIEPIFLRKLNGCTHSAIPRRGIHSAFEQLDRYMRKDREGTKYCLKLDVRKYYPSINHNKLKQMYRNIFKDKDLIWLLDEIIDSTDGDGGVPIGNYLSQYSGNLFLSKFDRWIKEEKRVNYYIRYMDYIVILHNNKTYLHELRKEIYKYMKNILDLQLKDNWRVFPSKIRGIDFVGYRHFGDYVLLRKSTSKRMIKKMRNIMKKLDNNGRLTYSEWCSINSYKG